MTPKTECNIHFGLYDTTAKADASYSTEDIQPFCRFSDLKLEGVDIPKYATMEHRQTLLDASFENFPDDTGNAFFGYWSATMSNALGRFGEAVFAQPPAWDFLESHRCSWDQFDALRLTWDSFEGDCGLTAVPYLDVAFTEDHSSAGLTFRFAEALGEWATEVTVFWYDRTGQVIGYRKSFPDAPSFYVGNRVMNYRSLHIEFGGTNKPYRYVKLAGLDFGLTHYLEGADIVKANLVEQVHAISAQVHINTLDCWIQSGEQDFYVLNPEGSFAFLQERQRLDVFELVDGGRVPLGTYYLDEMESESETVVHLKAIDLMGIIDKSNFEGGVYDRVPVADLVARIMDSAKADYTLDPETAAMRLSGHIPICSHREALQQVVFAAGAIATSARSDSVRIFPQSSKPVRHVGADERFYRGPVTLKTLVTLVEVTAHSYEPGDEGDRKELLGGDLAEGTYTVRFSEPVEPATLEIGGGEILSANANHAEIAAAGGEVSLTGIPYVDQLRAFTKELRNLPGTTSETIESVDGATLVGPDNADRVAQGIFTYMQMRHTETFGMIATGIHPANVIQVGHRGGGEIIGTVETMNTDLAAGFRADITLNFGSLLEKAIWDYAGEIYAGDGVGVI